MNIETIKQKQKQVETLQLIIDEIKSQYQLETVIPKIDYIEQNFDEQDIKIFETFLLSSDVSIEYATELLQELKNISLLNIVGVQPMQGPVGLTYKMRFKDIEEENKITLEIVTAAIEAVSRKYSNFKQDMFESIFNTITENCIESKSSRKNLRYNIMVQANNIARDTRRSPGNIVITNSKNVESLQSDQQSITIIVDDLMPENQILVGFKSRNMDAGLFSAFIN